MTELMFSRGLQFPIPDMAPNPFMELDLPLELALELGLLFGCTLRH